MNYAAIDIGSNAIRFLISEVNGKEIKNTHFERFPLRLGDDVFLYKMIQEDTIERLSDLILSLKTQMDEQNIAKCRIVATSAMRDTSNRDEVIEEVEKKTGLTIEVINGEEEATLMGNVMTDHIDYGNCLHVDAGGGSTEINIYNNKETIYSNSFDIGSVRKIAYKVSAYDIEMMKKWITDRIESNTKIVASGGSINALYKLEGKNNTLKKSTIDAFLAKAIPMTIEERVAILGLEKDRAEIIVPALEIYLDVINWCQADSVCIPSVGLFDGVIRELVQRT